MREAEHLSGEGQGEEGEEELIEIDYLFRKILIFKCFPQILGRIVDEKKVLLIVGISLGDCDEIGPSLEVRSEKFSKISQQVLVDDLVAEGPLVQAVKPKSLRKRVQNLLRLLLLFFMLFFHLSEPGVRGSDLSGRLLDIMIFYFFIG